MRKGSPSQIGIDSVTQRDVERCVASATCQKEQDDETYCILLLATNAECLTPATTDMVILPVYMRCL